MFNQTNFPNGLTIRELKEFIKDLPEKNSEGEEFTVWIDNHNGTNSCVYNIIPLDREPDGDCIELSAEQW